MSRSIIEDEAGRLAYSIPELAAKMGYHRKTIERMIDAGKLTAIRPFDGNRRVTAASVKALFEGTKEAK